MPVDTNLPETVLDEATKNFVRRAIQAGLVELADIKKVVVSLMTESSEFSPERLAEGLVGADLLTAWQSRKLLSGKARGFQLGNYRLLRPLGKGGMGVVFLAQHNVMKKLSALKILPALAAKDQRRIERFKEEARASATLEHPGIVQAYDFAEADGKLFIVMEYIAGIDLHRAVIKDGVMSPSESLDAIVQTTDALAHAHQRGIIHRDIKPSNLLLRNDGVIKVSDMGLARIGFASAENSDSPNRLTGTADFIAPEQAIDSQTVDARADIYSLGCTWYFLLVGKPPYSGTSVMQRLAKHQTAPVPPVSEHRSDCPSAMVSLIQKMMAKRPEDRPASAVELLNQLKRMAGGKSKGAQLANRPNAGGSFSASEDPSSFGTIDESSPQSFDTVVETPDIDFGSLPPIDPASSLPHMPAAAAGLPVNQFASPAPSNAKSNAVSASDDSRQNILLGIGLAIAIMALLVVVGMTMYQLTREDTERPKLKSTEEGGKQIVVFE